MYYESINWVCGMYVSIDIGRSKSVVCLILNVFYFLFFLVLYVFFFFFFFQADDGIRDLYVTGVQTCALPILKTPPGRSEYQAYRDESADPPALVVQVGSTELRYQLRCIDDLHAMLRERG